MPPERQENSSLFDRPVVEQRRFGEETVGAPEYRGREDQQPATHPLGRGRFERLGERLP